MGLQLSLVSSSHEAPQTTCSLPFFTIIMFRLQSKNGILEKVCDHMLCLKDTNKKLQDGHVDEVRNAEISNLHKKIEALENKNRKYQMMLKNMKFSNFENWSKKAKSITSRLMMGDPSVLSLAKRSTGEESDVDILRSAVMEAIPLSPTSVSALDPIQTTPDSTTNSIFEAIPSSTFPSSSFAVSVAETVTTSVSASSVATTTVSISTAPRTASDSSLKIKTMIAAQKKKSPAKSDGSEASITPTNTENQNNQTVKSASPSNSIPASASLKSSSGNNLNSNPTSSVGTVSQALMSNVQTVNSGYCASGYGPSNAAGLIQTSTPILSSIIQPQLSGQGLNCLSSSVLQPQSNTIIFGQQPGMLFSQPMIGGQYAVINPQPFIPSAPQVFPQLNAQIASSMQPFVQQLAGAATQSVLPTVGPVGQNIMQLENKSQFATAVLLPNGQLLPVVTQPSIIPASTATEVC